MENVAAASLVGLALVLLLAFGFEVVNGFHDTANAVATVIYTRTMPGTVAVVWSGIMNFLGVLFSSGAVAFTVVALLPVELTIHAGSGPGYAMVLAMLVSAIAWNLATWWRGLPASSSHTLIGAIIGVGLMNSVLAKGHVFGEGVNWDGVRDTVLSLLISPLIGFVFAGALLLIAKRLIKYPTLFEEPPEGKAPPWPVRTLLFLTCTGVSFAHGSNDGQKGMGVVMLILVGVLPAVYAVDLGLSGKAVDEIRTSNRAVSAILAQRLGASVTAEKSPPKRPVPIERAPIATGMSAEVKASSGDDKDEAIINDYVKTSGKLGPATFAAVSAKNRTIGKILEGKTAVTDISKADRTALRSDTYLVSSALQEMSKKKIFAGGDLETVTSYRKSLDSLTKYIPLWVKIATALALGVGTMIGWKRIVKTVGENIGNEHLTYGQGASAELVAYATILGADMFGLPVSTTHVLSSGVAGTMAANRSGLQGKTLRDIGLAWVLTLPVCVFFGSMIFAAGLLVVVRLAPK